MPGGLPRELRKGADVLADPEARDGEPVIAGLPEGTVTAALLVVKTVLPDGDTDIEVAPSGQCGWYDTAAMLRIAAEATERAATIRAMRNLMGGKQK